MNLSRLEQKTIANYNAAGQTATVYARDKAVMCRLDALKDVFPDTYKLIGQTDIDKTYEMPKSLVNFRKLMRVSEAQRAAAGERMKRLNNSTENT